MRVLILSFIVSCASAAPSGEVAAVLAPMMLPVPLQPIPAGDLQAAAIDAKVAAEDQARALADQARALADQARQLTEMEQARSLAEQDRALADQARQLSDVNQARALEEQAQQLHQMSQLKAAEATEEKKEEVVWSEEEKKWQALEAVNIAHAKLQGSIASMEGELASNAELIAKSMLRPVVAPVPLVFAAPGIMAPKPEAAPLKEAPQIVAKSGEIKEEMKEDKKEEKKELNDAEKALLKAQEELKKSEEFFRAALMKPMVYAAPVPAPMALAPAMPAPWMAPLPLYQPGFKTFAFPQMPYLAHVL